MPEYTGKARECLQKIFEGKIYEFALKNRIATEETINRMKSWTHKKQSGQVEDIRRMLFRKYWNILDSTFGLNLWE